MMTEQQHLKLLNAVTTYDEKQSRTKRYNPYALAQYIEALDNARQRMAKESITIRQVLLESFNDRLRDVCLKAVSEEPTTKEEKLRY